MTTIIETLKKDWNIQDTKEMNVKKLPAGNGYFLIFDENVDPLEWHAEFEGNVLTLDDGTIKVHAKTSIDNFIKAYKKAKLDAMDFDAEPSSNGYKEGEYAKIKEVAQDVSFEEYGEQTDVELPPPGNEILDIECTLSRIGNIKMGKKGEVKKSQKNGREYQLPERLDHFLVTTMEKGTLEKDGTTDFKTDLEIMSRLGPEPRSLRIRLVYDDINKNLRTSYARFKSAVCECRGDGRSAKLRNGKIIPCRGRNCDYFKDSKCKMNGVLNVVLEDAPVVGGVYQLRTTSVHTISNLKASMMQIQQGTCGLLAYLPLLLTISPKTVTLESGTTTDIYVANLVYRGSLEEMITSAKQTVMLRESMRYNVAEYDLLAERTEVVPEDKDEQRAIVEEFYGQKGL